MNILLILSTLLILAMASIVFGPRLACKTALGRRLLLPTVFVDYENGCFGFKEQTLLRKILTAVTIPVDGVAKAIYQAATGRELIWLYEPFKCPVQLMSPIAWEGRDATDQEKRMYLDQRILAITAVITGKNYRAMCYTRLAEIPQRQVPGSTDCIYQLVLF